MGNDEFSFSSKPKTAKTVPYQSIFKFYFQSQNDPLKFIAVGIEAKLILNPRDVAKVLRRIADKVEVDFENAEMEYQRQKVEDSINEDV